MSLDARAEPAASRAAAFTAANDAALNANPPDAAADAWAALPVPDGTEQASVHRYRLGVLQHRARRLVPAMLTFDELAEAAEQHDDYLLMMHVSRWQGVNWAMLGFRGRAQAAFTRAAAAAELENDPYVQAVALSNLGYLFGEQDLAEDYRYHTERALVLARASGRQSLVVSCLRNLAGALTRLRRLDEAASALDQAEALAGEHGLAGTVPGITTGRACLLRERGQLAEADAMFDRALEQQAAVGDHYQLARIPVLRARYALQDGQGSLARAYFEQALEVAERWSYGGVKEDVLGGLADARRMAGDLDGAFQTLKELLDLRTRREAERESERAQLDVARMNALKARWQAEEARRHAHALEHANVALRQALAREEALHAEVATLARMDPLTGLPNRRSLQDLLEGPSASPGASSIAILDIDHFKHINDRFGHAAGDAVLVEIGARLRSAVRAGDVVGRWGGEEFVILLNNCPSAEALRSADRLRSAIGATPIGIADGIQLPVTASVGVAFHGGAAEAPESTLAAADRALYEAKARGRDRAVLAP